VSARVATALVTIVAVLAVPAAALADGDPASDVLLLRDVYLPYAPQPAKAPAKVLVGLLADLRKAHYPVKVALIETRGDLGAYPELFGQPARYAKLLEREIAFKVHRPRLIVVMQDAGVAGRNLGPRADAILAAIKPAAAARSDGLVTAATDAVAKVAAADGHKVAVPQARPAASSGHGSSHTALYIVAALVVLAGIGLVAVSVRRPRSA
jgi:hypothetical protein